MSNHIYKRVCITEYQSWCIILHCDENVIQKKLLQLKTQQSSITVKCVFISAFLLHPLTSYMKSCNICFQTQWRVCRICRIPIIPIPCSSVQHMPTASTIRGLPHIFCDETKLLGNIRSYVDKCVN